RGRELSHPELGRVLLEKFSKKVEEHGVIERQPVLEGKSMFIVLASTHKPKVVEPVARPHRADEDGDDHGGEPAVTPEATEPAAAAEPAAAVKTAVVAKVAAAAPAAVAEPTAAVEPAAESAPVAEAEPAEATPTEPKPATKATKARNGAETAQAALPTTGD
ncbi:MAG: hypothetical protein ABIZ52_04815, partial [Candidatus Limnocylindrales bacterium]